MDKYDCCPTCKWKTTGKYPYCSNPILLSRDSEPTVTSYIAGIVCSEYEPKEEW